MPKFKSADNNLSIENVQKSAEGNIIEVRRFDRFNQTFEFDKENNQTVVRYKKSPFTPIKVYKAFLKIALSSIGEDHVADYKSAFEYLRTNKYDSGYQGFTIMCSYTMPITFAFEKPIVMVFRKKDNAAPLFTHVCMIYTLNFIYQLVIPFNRKDFHFFQNDRIIDTFWSPPIFGREYIHPVNTIRVSTLDFSSTDKLQDTTESLIFPMPEGHFEKARFKDKVTGEITEEDFDGTKIVGINLKRVDD